MALDLQLYIKALSPKLTAKALQTFDRATTVVVSACWAGAILMMAFAVYTTMLSVSAKHAAETAIVEEPALPKINHKSIDQRAAQTVVDRMVHRYPDINFSLANNQTLTVTAIDGSKFRQWLTALSYLDTISPEYHWSIQQFCVGKCHGNELMHAVLIGEKVYLEAP